MDVSKVGQDKQYKNPSEAVDAEFGAHKDNVEGMSDAEKLPLKELPIKEDPVPFSLGK